MRSVIWLHDNIRQHNNPLLEQALAQSSPQALLIYRPAAQRWLNLPDQHWLTNEPPRWQTAREAALAALQLSLPIYPVSSQDDIQQVLSDCSAEVVYCDQSVDWQVNQLRQGLDKIEHSNNLLLAISDLQDKFIGKFSKFYYAQRQHIQYQAASSLPPVSTFSQRLPITEPEALGWMQDYFRSAIDHYHERRNDLLGDTSFSRLSAALSIGSLSVTHLSAQVQQCRPSKATEQYLYELVWRDYFHWLALRLGSALFARPAPLNRWQSKAFYDWCFGQTGLDIVDAGSNELRQTGFVSNRIRQLMASALVHNLHVPWQYGAAFFEQQLWDYHPASNYGNWAYIAGGTPVSKTSHTFDLAWQSERYDPDGAYRKTYL